MKLESQVTSLELSKQLQELGIKQESLFYYKEWSLCPIHLVYTPTDKEYISAFTLSELFDILAKTTMYWYVMIDYDRCILIEHYTKKEIQNEDENICNALAKNIITLLGKEPYLDQLKGNQE